MAKDDFYTRIKVAGMLSFVPLVLVAGPLLGYVSGEYLVKKFGLPGYVSLITIGLGFLSSVMEIVKIIRKAKEITG